VDGSTTLPKRASSLHQDNRHGAHGCRLVIGVIPIDLIALCMVLFDRERTETLNFIEFF